ncbi:uncharacterized protein LOC135207944 isoform X2 [Macrobrachium nipponense]|uniref:uncharacterized protein LOC135207944 isoform X2 n=1 Tax=Macrobrachium nipponense TaxID=159736 RepID=UPI0030C7D219
MPPIYTKQFVTYFVDSGQRRDKIVIVGSPMSHSEAEERRKAVRLLLATAELVKLPAQDLVYRNLVIVAFPTGDQSLFLCRGVITDIQPWTETVQVQVLLVDECQKDIIVSPDWIFACPQFLSVYPTVIQQYILADILPAKKEWPPGVISYLRSKLVKKFVPVIRDIEDDKFGYISPLEPDGFGLPIVCRLINESWALPAVSFPGLITGVLEELQIEYPKLATLFLPFRKELTLSDHFIKTATYKTMQLPTNSYEECQISHCTVGPWKFYLQFKQQIESYRKLQGKLRLYFDSGKLGQVSLKIGSSVLCYIRNLKEEEYQRGLVTGEVSNNEIPVYLVDKGATLKLRKDLLWELPVELLDTPICMIKCCLDGLPEVVDPEVSNAFGEVIQVHSLKCKVVKMDEGKLIKVSMLASGCDVLKMITPSFKRSQLVTSCKVFISYVCKSDNVIYVHLSRESPKLEDLQRKLQEVGNSALVMEEPEVNMTCLARYDDGYWYRGMVLETGAYYKVKYVDYGNSGRVSHGNVRELSLELIGKLPAQAIPCILSEVPMKGVTSALVEEFFGPIGESEIYVKIIGLKKHKLESASQEVAVVEMISEKGLSLNRYLEEKLNKRVVDNISSASSYTSHVIREVTAKSDNPKSLPEFNQGMQTENQVSSGSSNYLSHNVDKVFMAQDNTSPQVNQSGVNKLPVVEVKPGTYGQVRLSCVGRACFFVTLQEKETVIQAMREILREKCQGASANDIEGLNVGWLVASFDDSDRLWHRGLVTGCLGILVELTLIDSGKDLVVEKLSLQKLPDIPLVLSTPAQAIKCTLLDGRLNPGRIEHMKKEVGMGFLAHFCKEDGGLWEVKLYSEKVVGDGEKRGTENSSLKLETERSGNTFSKEEASKCCKEETSERNASVCSFLQELTRSSEIDPGTSAEKSDRKPEETKWESLSRQCKSASGPIRNKSHRYHAASASERWRDGSNDNRTYNSQWRETKTSSTSSTQSEETSFVKPVRNREFGLFRSRKQSATQDTPLKTKSSHATVQNVVENVYKHPSRSFGEVKNQEKKFSWKPAKEMVSVKNCNKAEDDSFMGKALPSDDNWSDNQNSLNGYFKKIPSIPPAQVMCDNVFDAVITSIEDDGSFWIQSSQQIPSLDKLMQAINESDTDLLKVMNATPEIGRPCLCVYAEDERYYRAVVKEFHNTDCAIVHYVDYGNSSEVKVCDIRLIPTRFLDLPCQAIHCYFSKILREKSLDVLHQKLEEILSEELKVSLTKELQDEDFFVMKSLTVKDVDILSKIQKEQMHLETLSSGNIPQVNQINENCDVCHIPYLKINYVSEITAYICHVDTDGIFWVQLTANTAVLEEVMEKLNDIGSPCKRTLSRTVPGVPCLCQFAEDGRFYRAEIKEVLPTKDTALVQYVDYGNVDHVQIENLALLPEEFTAIPRQAICCSFRKDIRNKWSQNTQTHLEAFVEQECTLMLVEGTENEKENVIVRLAIGGVDILSHIASELEIDVSVRSEMAESVLSETAEVNVNILESSVPFLSLTYDSEITAYVSHVDNDSLWIQLSDKSTDLEEMEEKLNDCALSPLTHAPEINCLYACRSADDGRLYRAVVREVGDEVGVTVHYVDHGNNSHAEVEHLFPLSSAFLALPRQAIQCHLSKKKEASRPMTIQSLDELLNQEVVLSLKENYEDDNRNILLSCTLDGKEIFLEQKQSLHVESNEKGEKLSDYEAGFENKIDSVKPAVCPVDDATLACPSWLPIRFNETFKAYVCHVEHDSIWIQYADKLEDLEAEMKKLNESPPLTLHTRPVLESVCVSQYSIDGMYYRCIVQEIDDDMSIAVVHFIDYGNREQVPITDLYEIPDCYRSLPRQAVQCYFKKEMKQGDAQSLLNQVLEVSVHEEVKDDKNIIVLDDVCGCNGVSVLSDFLEVIPGVNQEKGFEEPDGILERAKQELKEPNGIDDEIVKTSRNTCESQEYIDEQCTASVVTQRSSASDVPDVTEIEPEPTMVESNILGKFPVHQKEKSGLCSAPGLEVFDLESNRTARSVVKPETDIFSDEDSEKCLVTVNQDESPLIPGLECANAIQDMEGDDCHIGTELSAAFDQVPVQHFALKDMETVYVGDKFDVSSSCNEVMTTPSNVERYGKRFKAVICHIENNGSLWLQPLDELPTLHDMMTKLNELAESSLEAFTDGSVDVGVVCVCTYTTDRRLYRAHVKKLIDDENFVVVHFLDYGYEEYVKMEELRKLPECFKNIPAQAVHCYFSKLIRENWSEYHNQLIIDIKSEVCLCLLSDEEGDGNLIVQELHSEERDILRMMSLSLDRNASLEVPERNASLEVPCLDPLKVDMTNSAVEEMQAEEKTDSNIAIELPSDSISILPTYSEDDFHTSSIIKVEGTSIDVSLGNLAYQDEETAAVAEPGISEVTCRTLVLLPQNCIEYDVTFDAVVSHIESNGSLWLQASTHLPALNSIMKMLNELDIHTLEPIEHAFIGSVCLCPYTEDGRLYRVVIRELLDGDCPVRVHYVDYGNEDFVKRDSLWKIPEDISQSVFHLPMQAIHCYPSKNIGEYCQLGIEDEVKVSLSLSDDGINVLDKVIVQDLDDLSKGVGSLENQDCQGIAEIPSSNGDGLQHLVSLDSGGTGVQENAVEVSLYQQHQSFINDCDADETERDTEIVKDTIEIKPSEGSEVHENLIEFSSNNPREDDENLIEFPSSNPTEDNCISDILASQIFAMEPSSVSEENDSCINEHFVIDREHTDTNFQEALSELGVQSPLSGDGLSKIIATKNTEYALVDFREIPAENSSGETKHVEEVSGRKDYYINEENEALKGRSVKNEDCIFFPTVPFEDPLLLEKREQFEHSCNEKSFDLNLDLQNYANNQGQEHQLLLDSEEKPDDFKIDRLCTSLDKCMEVTEFKCSYTDKPNVEESLNESYPDEQYLVEFQAVAESFDFSHQSLKLDYDHCKQGTPPTNPAELIVEITGKSEIAEFFLESEETCGIFYSESPRIGTEYEAAEEQNAYGIAPANDVVQSLSELVEIQLAEETSNEHEESNCSFEKNEWEIQQQELDSCKYPDDDAKLIEVVEFVEVGTSQESSHFIEDEKNLKQTDDVEVSSHILSVSMKDAESVYEQRELPCVEKSSEEEQITGGSISDWNSADEINKMATEVRLTSDGPELLVSGTDYDERKAQQYGACVDGSTVKKHVELCARSLETLDSRWLDTPPSETAVSELQSSKTPGCLGPGLKVEPESMKCLLDCFRLEPETSKVVPHDLEDRGRAFALQSNLVSGKEVFIMNIHAPGCLSIILKNDLKRLHNIQQSLHGSAEQLKLQELKKIHPGMGCVVESEDGKTMYRATILDVEGGNANVNFVDEGKMEIVPQEKLKQIPQNLLDPPCIYTCEVKPKNKEMVLSCDQIHSSIQPFIKKPLVLTAEDGKGKQVLTFQYCGKEVLEDFVCSVLTPVSQKTLVMDYPTCSGISESETIPSVSVESVPRAKRSFDKSKSFLHIIDEEGEDSDETSVIQCYKALVVNVEENPFSLWVQKEEDFNHVTFITKTLSSEGLEFGILEHPKKGQLCLCVLNDVKQRAKLISFDDNTALVHYIDLGKYDIVSRQELFKLEDELTDIHPLASQVFLPVSVKKGMECVSGSVTSTAVLGQLCYCIDLRTQADGKIKTIVVSSGQGDLGKFLVRMDLAIGVSFDPYVEDQVSLLVNRFCQGHANEP